MQWRGPAIGKDYWRPVREHYSQPRIITGWAKDGTPSETNRNGAFRNCYPRLSVLWPRIMQIIRSVRIFVPAVALFEELSFWARTIYHTEISTYPGSYKVHQRIKSSTIFRPFGPIFGMHLCHDLIHSIKQRRETLYHSWSCSLQIAEKGRAET